MEELREDNAIDSTKPIHSLVSNRGRIDAELVGKKCHASDMIVLSHLRWDFVFQRPQHLMTRYAKERRVYFFEEPIFEPIRAPRLEISSREDGLTIAIPRLPQGLGEAEVNAALSELLDGLIDAEGIEDYLLWYYTPMALGFSSHLEPSTVIYDCMDELSAFKNSPPQLLRYEADLLESADLVFTGGVSLFEAKRHRHPRVHAFPSSIDYAHFSRARNACPCPADQLGTGEGQVRVGFFGVLDERADLELIDGIAALRPEWSFIMIGPVVKIDPTSLPRRPNIHYLGMKSYAELPLYLAHWDLAILPFALNESTRFISPTKTPEYLAAGRPVVSTPIRDVVRPYGDVGLVKIASRAPEFIEACEAALADCRGNGEWLEKVDRFLADSSWDKTWEQMAELELELRDAGLTVEGHLSHADHDSAVSPHDRLN